MAPSGKDLFKYLDNRVLTLFCETLAPCYFGVYESGLFPFQGPANPVYFQR